MAERAMRPFWIHQLAEYLIGVALVAQGLQEKDPLVPAVAGVLVIVNASVVRGPLGAQGDNALRVSLVDVFEGGELLGSRASEKKLFAGLHTSNPSEHQ